MSEKNKNIYKGLECHCSEFERIPIHRRDFGATGIVISNGLVIAENLSIETLDKHLKNNGIDDKMRKIPKINIMMNFGILNFLYKKAEGKSNQRALTELGVETSIGLAATSKLAVKTGVSLLTRIATGAAAGAAVGSSAPIVGTIIGAVAGALIAGVVNDIIFAEEDKALAEAKAENERIAKLQSQYQDKINQITSYLTNNHYIELRELTELEAEMLCKNLSNLDMDSKSGIALMLSFPHYLKKESKQEVYTPLSPQGISFPYSSIIYLTTIKALKDTLKEYLPKAKKIVLYTPNPFVSLYTSSPFY
ncbi:hypothetical protein CNT07_09715, partial [Campylobacter coli]|nr:hypothetical protein [Campylobacter coli]